MEAMKSIREIINLNQIPSCKESTETGNKFGLFRVGYSVTPQEVKFECALCQDREIVESVIDPYGLPIFKICSCKPKRELEKKLKSSGLTKKNLRYKIEDYQVNEENQEMYAGVIEYLKKWGELLNSDSNSKGFGLIGTPGIGKTMLSSIIASRMLDSGVSVVFVPTTDLMAELKQAQFSKDKEQNMEAKVEALSKTEVLILDDLGSEKPTEWIQSMYYRVVDMRYRNDKLTGFSSNLMPNKLSDWLGDEFGPKTVSRLIEMTRDYFFVAKAADHRIMGEA